MMLLKGSIPEMPIKNPIFKEHEKQQQNYN